MLEQAQQPLQQLPAKDRMKIEEARLNAQNSMTTPLYFASLKIIKMLCFASTKGCS